METIKRNLQATGLKENAKVLLTDAGSFLSGRHQPFDVALLDPPYSKGLLQEMLPRLAPLMNPGGVIVCECPLAEELPPLAGEFSRTKEYRYGKIKLAVYRREAESDRAETDPEKEA